MYLWALPSLVYTKLREKYNVWKGENEKDKNKKKGLHKGVQGRGGSVGREKGETDWPNRYGLRSQREHAAPLDAGGSGCGRERNPGVSRAWTTAGRGACPFEERKQVFAGGK